MSDAIYWVLCALYLVGIVYELASGRRRARQAFGAGYDAGYELGLQHGHELAQMQRCADDYLEAALRQGVLFGNEVGRG